MKNKLNISDNFEMNDSIILDNDEMQLLKAMKESNSIVTDSLIKKYQQIALTQKKRTKQLSMRLTDEDYLLAKTKSIEEGIPYQVLLSSVIHKWLHGKYKEI